MKLTKKKTREKLATINRQQCRAGKQHASDVARCQARYAEETAERSAFMASDAARFIIARDWKRTLADMITKSRGDRYLRNRSRNQPSRRRRRNKQERFMRTPHKPMNPVGGTRV